MKGTIEFFMTPEENTQFLEFLQNECERVETNFAYSELWIGANYIQYQPSKVFANQLTAGRLAYMTQDISDGRAEVTFKKLKAALKKSLDNNMRLRSNFNGATSATKSFYFSIGVSEWIREDINRRLVQFKDGAVSFFPISKVQPTEQHDD